MLVGETLGFAVAAGIAVAATAGGWPPSVAVPAIVAAGGIEGLLLASGQLIGLGRFAPRRGPWLAATSVGAAVAWAIGMAPSTLGLAVLDPVVIAFLVGAALVLLAAIPTAQWLVIRHRPGSLRWIPGNMGAWAAAAIWTAAPSPFIDENSPIVLVALLYVAAGVLMAATVAVLTAPLARSVFARAA